MLARFFSSPLTIYPSQANSRNDWPGGMRVTSHMTSCANPGATSAITSAVMPPQTLRLKQAGPFTKSPNTEPNFKIESRRSLQRQSFYTTRSSKTAELHAPSISGKLSQKAEVDIRFPPATKMTAADGFPDVEVITTDPRWRDRDRIYKATTVVLAENKLPRCGCIIS